MGLGDECNSRYWQSVRFRQGLSHFEIGAGQLINGGWRMAMVMTGMLILDAGRMGLGFLRYRFIVLRCGRRRWDSQILVISRGEHCRRSILKLCRKMTMNMKVTSWGDVADDFDSLQMIFRTESENFR